MCKAWSWRRDARLDIMSYSHPQQLTLKQQFCGIFGFSATGAVMQHLPCTQHHTAENLGLRPHQNISTYKKYFTHKIVVNTILLTSQKLFVIKSIKIFTLMSCAENILFFLDNEDSHTFCYTKQVQFLIGFKWPTWNHYYVYTGGECVGLNDVLPRQKMILCIFMECHLVEILWEGPDVD